MSFLLTLHGEIRWLVALAGLAVIARSLLGWARGATFGTGDRVLMSGFTTLLDVNLLLGLILLFRLPGGFTANRLEHAVTMLAAVLTAHAWVAWKKSDDASRKFRNNLFVAVAVLALVALGVLRLRGGWLY
jgi:hypothetical protein